MLQGGGVLIEYGEGTDAEFLVVTGNELFEPVAGGGADSLERFESVFKGEDAITSALIRLREARKSKVAFTTGHGESAPSDLNPSGQGIGIWRARLSSVGCELIDLNLIADAIPDDLALLVIAGPKSPVQARGARQAEGLHGPRRAAYSRWWATPSRPAWSRSSSRSTSRSAGAW